VVYWVFVIGNTKVQSSTTLTILISMFYIITDSSGKFSCLILIRLGLLQDEQIERYEMAGA